MAIALDFQGVAIRRKIRHHTSGIRALRCFATYLSVERRARVLFNPKDVEVKSCLELGVRYVCLLESETSWADKSFVLRCFPREALPDESDLRRDNHVKHKTHENTRKETVNLSQAVGSCALLHDSEGYEKSHEGRR